MNEQQRELLKSIEDACDAARLAGLSDEHVDQVLDEAQSLHEQAAYGRSQELAEGVL